MCLFTQLPFSVSEDWSKSAVLLEIFHPFLPAPLIQNVNNYVILTFSKINYCNIVLMHIHNFSFAPLIEFSSKGYGSTEKCLSVLLHLATVCKKERKKKKYFCFNCYFNSWQNGIGLRMPKIGRCPNIVMHDWKNPSLVTLQLLHAQSARALSYVSTSCSALSQLALSLPMRAVKPLHIIAKEKKLKKIR